MAKTYAIDFDGVIHDYKHPKPGMKMGLPMPGAAEALALLHGRGHTVIIHSVRGNERDVIRKWMEYYMIPFDSITNVKPQADFYVDDKAVHFDNWADTLKVIL